MSIDPELRQLDKAIAFLEAGDAAAAQGRISVVIHRLSNKLHPLDFAVTCASCGARHLFEDRATHRCWGAL